MVLILLFGFGVSLVVSSFLGIVSDLIGPQKVCLLFFMLHLSVAIWKRFVTNPSLWLAGVALSIASLIYSFSFETWLVVEHDKLGQKQDMLNDMFWLMIFFESVSFLGSQIPGNWFVGSNLETNGVSLSIVALVIAIISIILSLEDIKSHHGQYLWMIISNCLEHISYMADGREVVFGLIYPCLLGARMLGSTAYPWFFCSLISFRAEECLGYIFFVMGVLLSIIVYDYQEINMLMTLFCLFHICMGMVLPSLARLRTLYASCTFVPNELCGGMASLSLAPGNAAILIFFVQDVTHNRGPAFSPCNVIKIKFLDIESLQF